MLDIGVGMGRGAHIIIARVKANRGEVRNRIWDEAVGRIGSFTKSLIPSAMGWRAPKGPTTLGPLRFCI